MASFLWMDFDEIWQDDGILKNNQLVLGLI